MICFIVRWQLSSELDRDGERGWLVRRHLGRCARCQDAERRLHALHERLIRAAPAAPSVSRAIPRPTSFVWIGAAALTAAVIFTIVAVRSGSDAPSRPAMTEHPRPAIAAPSRTRELAASVARWADADPLRAELVALKSDAVRGAKAAARIAGIR